MPYSLFFEEITAEIDSLIKPFSHTKKDIGYGYRRTFDNNLRFDLIDYKKHNKTFLRVGRGARLVKTYPVLHGLFDSISKVIAKFQVHTIETLHTKHLIGLLKILDEVSNNIIAKDMIV